MAGLTIAVESKKRHNWIAMIFCALFLSFSAVACVDMPTQSQLQEEKQEDKDKEKKDEPAALLLEFFQPFRGFLSMF